MTEEQKKKISIIKIIRKIIALKFLILAYICWYVLRISLYINDKIKVKS